MTVEEIFCDLFDKYGDDFNWHVLPFTNKTFVAELKREIGQNHLLYNKQIWAVAKCDSNDNVLFVTGDDSGRDIYFIFHLTYSETNAEGFPTFKKLVGIEEVKKYIEESFIQEYL